MKKKSEDGFSLIELLLVVVCIGVIASISINYFIKARIAAQNTSAISVLSLMRQNEILYHSRYQRFARLDELHALHGNLGNVQGDLTLTNGPFKFELTTTTGTPTATDPKNLSGEYLITATRTYDNSVPYVYTLDQTGEIKKILPVPGTLGE